MNIKDILNKRTEELLTYREEAVRRLKMLRYKGEPQYHISVDSKKKQFYLRTGDTIGKGKYIPQNKLYIAKQVASFEYLNKSIQLIDKEIKYIDSLEKNMGTFLPEDYYESLSVGRQNLVEPLKLTDKQFVETWLNEPYERSSIPFGTAEFYTDNGERVRSKSEIIIANALAKHKVPYKYECPIYMKELGVIHPDFSALNIKKRKLIYWEHPGKLDDPGYARDNAFRINVYQKNGVFPGDNLITTWETSTMPLDVKLLEQIIRHYLLE